MTDHHPATPDQSAPHADAPAHATDTVDHDATAARDVTAAHSGAVRVTGVQWRALREAAVEAMGHAYAPYSKFPVGVAALVDDGRIITGCNVENASYPVGQCAEATLVKQLHLTGGGFLVAFDCVDGAGNTLMPCGRCRQILFEASAPGMLLNTVSGVKTIDEVLPDAFGPRTLAEYADAE